MKFNFLNFKKNQTPPLSSLRPPIFDVRKHWLATLGLSALIFIITALIGAKLFYTGYFETYKKQKTGDDFQNIIDIKQLKRVVEKRNNFIKTESTLPKDPSL